jgi:hypothetical protein
MCNKHFISIMEYTFIIYLFIDIITDMIFLYN